MVGSVEFGLYLWFVQLQDTLKPKKVLQDTFFDGGVWNSKLLLGRLQYQWLSHWDNLVLYLLPHLEY